MTKVEKLVSAFKLTGLTESGSIELDNLDRARVVYNEENEVVIENEHGSQYGVDELSNVELDIFIEVLGWDVIDTLAKLQDRYIDRCVFDTDFNSLDDYEQLIGEIDEALDFDDFIKTISLWSHEDIDIRFNKVFGVDTKYFKENLVDK